MSFQAMANVVKINGLKPTEKLVLLLLANYADEHNKSYPSYETISIEAGCSRRTAISTIQKLADNGYISIKNRRKNNTASYTNIYTILDKKGGEKSALGGSENISPYSEKNDIGGSENISPYSEKFAPNTITNTINKEPTNYTKSKKPKKLTYEQKCENFNFDEPLILKIKERFSGINKNQAINILETFRAMAINRDKPFKNIKQGFITYLNNGYLDKCLNQKTESVEQSGLINSSIKTFYQNNGVSPYDSRGELSQFLINIFNSSNPEQLKEIIQKHKLKNEIDFKNLKTVKKIGA